MMVFSPATALPSISSTLPPMRRVRLPPSVSTSISHVWGPLCRQSKSAVMLPPKVSAAAIGVWRFSGNVSVAPVRCTGAGKISVRIDRALMPGSNTPMPPASNTQSWPGCHLRTSSRHVIWARVTRRCASHAFAPATPCAMRLCHVANRDTPLASAKACSA